ncbi:MAG: peroxidase family protein [Paracoccaceae bacterium]
MFERLLDSLLGRFARLSQRVLVWHAWPFIPALAIVLGHRVNLRRHNLINTETAELGDERPEGFDIIGWRTADGSYNDLAEPRMGASGVRFGRNVAIRETYPPSATELMEPSPRLVSEKLLKRHEFVPVPHLNILAAGWIQFMVHDWLSHGPNDPDADPHEIPLPQGDDWPGGKMTARRTMPDQETSDADVNRPPTYRNTETSWWDGSQIYGSTEERLRYIRTANLKGQPKTAEIALDNGMLPLDKKAKRDGQELAGVNGNWWTGLSVLHTLFAREHNAIVARLRIDHGDESEDWLFHKARLVNAALMAKIHTVEWTPALMDSPEGRMAMRGNYWGLMGETVFNAFGRLSESEVVSGIPGSAQDHHGAPYAMTEEFSAVYRLHSLMPDQFQFRSHSDNTLLREVGLVDVAGPGARALYDEVNFDDVLYSLGTEHPGALVLNNFPEALRKLDKKVESNLFIDLAAVDILRDRERGVPRYAAFRESIGATRPETFADITDDQSWQAALKEVYGTVDKVDLLVGTLAEAKSKNQPPRFGFSDTAFRIFILMASRRLKSDRFFADDFRPEIYTEAGFRWVAENGFADVVRRHCPELADAMSDTRNPFFPWQIAGT